MGNISLGRGIASALFFLALAVLPGCQEEKETAAAPSPAAPSAESVTRQSAPVPQGQALEILMLGPSGTVKKLSQIAVMFNQPMVALGDYGNVPAGAMKIEPPQDGTYKWLNQYTLAFTPKEPLEGSAELSVEVPAGLAALSGATLAEGKTVAVTLPRLALVNIRETVHSPRDVAEALTPTWALTLNQKVDPASLSEKAKFIYRHEGREYTTASTVSDDPGRFNYYGGYTYLLTPATRLPKNTEYKIVLEAGIQSLSGPLPSERMVVAEEASTFGPLTARVDDDAYDQPVLFAPGYPVRIAFSNMVKVSEAVRALTIDNGYDLTWIQRQYPLTEASPDGAEDVGGYQAAFNLPGGFKPKTTYTLRFDENLTDIFGQKLGPQAAITFTTGSYDSYVRLDETPGQMETSAESKIPLIMSNIPAATLRGYAFTVPEAISFLGAEPGGRFYNDYELARQKIRQEPVTMEFTPPDGAADGPVIMPVDLAAMFGERLHGRLLFLESFFGDKESTETLLQISDIGLAVKTGLAGGLIWTTDLAKGQSWPGVELSLYSTGGQELWRGQSDENGLARVPAYTELVKKAGEEWNFFVVGEAAGQMSLWMLAWDEGLETWRWNVNYDNPVSRHEAERYWLLNALPLYKPGETAEFKIIARERRGEALADVAGQKFKMIIADGQGKQVEEADVTSDAYGSISHKVAIPQNAALGSWSVSLLAAGDESSFFVGSFLVMTYRAPAFDIAVNDVPQKAVAGEKAELKLAADYHFGAPVSGQPVAYEVSSGPLYYFSVPGFSDFNFINDYSSPDEYDESGYGYQEPTSTVSSNNGTLDEAGRFTLPLDLTPAPGLKPRPRTYNAYISVTDVDRRVISTETSFTVHPADVYVGLKADDFLCAVGEECAFQSVLTDASGNLVTDREYTFTIYHRQWQNVRRKTPGNTYEYVSRVVDDGNAYSQASLEAHAKGAEAYPLKHSFTPTKPGSYWVLAEAVDDKGRKNQASATFYVRGDGDVGWQMSNNDQIALVADKKEYKPGDTARILVQSPFSEGEGLLTVERAGVRQARTFTIENQTPTLEIPITEDDAPNIYVSVLLTRGRIADKPDENGVDLGKPAMRMGYVELKVPARRDLLRVEISPDTPETSPGGEVEVSIAVKDNDGKPFAEAEIALIAADAAVLQLAGDESYYPDRYFMADESLAVMNAHNLTSLIGRRNWGIKGGNPGGGGGLEARMAGVDGFDARRLFKALAYFDPGVKLDAGGRATVKIKMPENPTTFKLYAVATGHGKKSGTGVSQALVTRDLLLRSALPGYAGAGDSFAAAMVVTNRGKNSGTATVKLAGDNFILAEGEQAEKTVEIEAGASVEVPFRVTARTAGTARFLFSATMGAESDAAEYALDVIPPNKLRVQASYERLEPGEKRVELALPAGYDPARGGLALTVSPSLLGLLGDSFDYLADYPHRCVEQETSRAFGSLLLLDLHKYLPEGADEAKLSAARAHIADHLERLAQWQTGDGGFTFWPDDRGQDSHSVYLTAYVLEFMEAARQRDFAVDEEHFKKWVTDFLLSSLKSDYKWPAWYSEEAITDSQSYAIAALSRAGVNVAAYIEFYYQRRGELSLNQLVNLIRAIGFQPKGSGQAAQLRELLPLLNKYMSVTAGEAQLAQNTPGLKELWASPTRDNARILETLCLVAPHNRLVEPLLRNLMTQMRANGGHFGNTQNNAAALAAALAYGRALEPEAPNLRIQALLGDFTLLDAQLRSYTDPPVSSGQPLAALAAASALTYKAEGTGQAWASLKLETAPAEPDLSADTSGGFMLSRSFTVIKPEGREGVEKFRRGDIVRVSVTMMLPASRYNVALEDRVPAGFEPVNFQLADADMSLLGLTDADSGYWYNHQEIRPDRVTIYANRLPAGVYTYSYLARAITPGRYTTPGPVAEEMYSPETHGRGQGQVLTVD